MRSKLGIGCGVVVMAMAFAAQGAGSRPGLYADEAQAVTQGELNDQDYWWARFDAMMLEEAVRTHQPEGRIAVDLASSLRRLDALAEKYPHHAEIQKWGERAREVEAKIDPDADRRESYKPGFLWGEANYAQAWVNWHWAQAALAQHDVQQARGLLSNVVQNLTLLRKPHRMDAYPEETRRWVEETAPQAAEKLRALNAPKKR